MKTRGVVLLAYALRTAAADDRATHELTVAGERRLALPIVNSSGAILQGCLPLLLLLHHWLPLHKRAQQKTLV